VVNELLTDLYELNMAQAYLLEGMTRPATFELHVRRLPAVRNYVVACGLGDVLAGLESLRFTPPSIAHLRAQGFGEPFLDWLRAFRFEGDVVAMPEGTPAFPEEPLLQVTGPLPQVQLIETLVLHEVHLQTVIASKAARVVAAAGGRPVIDFGLRRTLCGVEAVRAMWVAGIAGTSNVLASQRYPSIPAVGTMAHSYVQAHASEDLAFRAWTTHYAGSTLLVDTFDTLEGVRRAIPYRPQAIRLDSGNLARLARDARRLLDEAGLAAVRIVASGGLDEYVIAGLRDAPIDAYGVGTRMGVSEDAPSLDMAYKLTEYDGLGRVKLSEHKRILPGRKQVFRTADGDVIARHDESRPGRALLEPVMRGGRVLRVRDLDEARATAAAELARLPTALRGLSPAPWPVQLSDRLAADYAEACRRARC
jgi:nicotinate phosphoribosyltransferase